MTTTELGVRPEWDDATKTQQTRAKTLVETEAPLPSADLIASSARVLPPDGLERMPGLSCHIDHRNHDP